MGDFSRDPKERLTDSVSKHYVGVRLQQGVPIIDADWNELEDLRKHELSELFRRFIGNGVPSENDGFRIEALAGGGVGTIVLEVQPGGETLTAIEINLSSSTAANILGFLPGNTYTERKGSSPASLTGNAAEPFELVDGLTLAIRVNNGIDQIVTFASDDFTTAGIGAATAEEVVKVINASVSRMIAIVGTGNDFIIVGGDGNNENAGCILVDGVETLNETNLTFSSQPLYKNTELANSWKVEPVEPLETPEGEGEDDYRDDIVYLDVWEREVNNTEDDSIIDPLVGVETTCRLRREWTVRVLQNATDISKITRLPDHKYLILAKIKRFVSYGEQINDVSISDHRRIELNLSKYLKTPIFVKRGSHSFNASAFAQIMENLREILIVRLQRRIFNFGCIDAHNCQLVHMALQDIIYNAAYGANQAKAGNFNNQDGLVFLVTIYKLQKEFVRVIEDYCNSGAVAREFIDEYRKRLDGSSGEDILGLRPATKLNDLIAAAEAQKIINDWLSAPVDLLPEGSVLVTIRSVYPSSNLAFGTPFSITYLIESLVVSAREREVYQLTCDTETPTTWDISLNQSSIELDAYGGSGSVALTVTPNVGSARARFRLSACAQRNPDVVRTVNVSDVFQIGSPPPTVAYIHLIGVEYDENSRIRIQQSDFSDQMFRFQMKIANITETQQTYDVSHYVIPPEGDTTGAWHPTESVPATGEITLESLDTTIDVYSIFGPVAPDIDTEGRLFVRVTPTAAGTELNEQTIDLAFIVVAG